MKKNNWLFIILILLVLGAVLYYLIKSNTIDLNNLNIDFKPSTQEENNSDFKMYAEYVSDNTWEYTITGTIPSPCYSVEIEPIIMESYPEQVILNIIVSDNSTEGLACTQVITDVERTGTFQASQEATIKLETNE